MIDQPRDDASLIADLVQMSLALADCGRRDLPDDCEHRRIHSIGGEQCGAGIKQARARHDGVGLRLGSRQRRAERHISRALFMAGVNDAKIVARTLEGIKQVIVVDAGQGIDGVEPMREQRGNGGLAGGQVHVARTRVFCPAFSWILALVLRMAASGYEASNVQIAGVLSRAVQFRALVFVDIAEQQHAAKLAFIVARESAARSERLGVAICPEQTIPDRQVREIKTMHVELVMDRMQFGRLDKVSDPTRRLDIGMIKQLARCSEKIEPERAFERSSRAAGRE